MQAGSAWWAEASYERPARPDVVSAFENMFLFFLWMIFEFGHSQ
jgi:hypothetical protein